MWIRRFGIRENMPWTCIFFLQYFQKDMPAFFEADAEGVINLAFSIKINQKKMKKLEKEYTTMKTKEKEDEIELRVRVFLFFYNYAVYTI